MKKILFLLVFLSSFLITAQSLNSYKYALVPAKFSLFKNDDYYRLSVLTKMYMEKNGFVTYMDNEEQPIEFASNNCNKVFVDLTEDNGMFLTKIKVVLKDCYGKVIAVSNEGKSRDKSYIAAYYEALRNAFESFPELKEHQYKENIVQVSKTEEVKVVKTETQSVVQPSAIETSKTNLNVTEVFAKPYQNGFQLLTNTTAVPNLVLIITKTSSPDYFIAEQNENKGVLLKKSDGWYFEFYKEGKLVTQKYTIVNF